MNKKFKDIGYIIVLRDCDDDLIVADCYDLNNPCGYNFRDVEKTHGIKLIPHLWWDKKVYCKYYNRFNRARVIKKTLAKYPNART